MLDLPNVTLLFVETRAHKITERVIADCIAKCNFGEILLYTDKPDLIRFDPDRKARTILCPDFANKKDAGQFYYQHACAGISTEYALMLEWDAGIYDVSKWTPEFLKYDYIGAPWQVRPQEHNCLDVGNGGFTIMSKKLGCFLTDHAHDFPVFTDWDLCRNNRARLEAQGFTWAGRDLAARFSWELCPMIPGGPFGYHGAFNWPEMLPRAEIIERAKIMLTTPYLTAKMVDLVRRGKATWLEAELGEELWSKYSTRYSTPNENVDRAAAHRLAQQKIKMNQIITQRRLFYASQMQKSGLKA